MNAGGDIKIKVDADGSGIEQVFKDIHTSLNGVNATLKTFFVTAMATAVTTLTKATIDFVINAKKSSDELGVTMDRAIQLNRVMSAIGKGGGDLVGSMKTIQAYMASAYYDAFKLSRLKLLGLSTEDFKNFDFDKVLRKSLEATKGMGQAMAQQLMVGAYGSVGVDYLMNRDRILDRPSETGLSDEQAEMIVELKLQFMELMDSIKALIAEAIVPFGNVLLRSIAWFKDITPGLWGKPGNFNSFVDKEINREFEAQHRERATADNTILPDSQRLPELTGGNPFLSVGGIAGVDTSFRIERYLANMEAYLNEINKKMDRDTKQNPSETSLPMDPLDILHPATAGRKFGPNFNWGGM